MEDKQPKQSLSSNKVIILAGVILIVCMSSALYSAYSILGYTASMHVVTETSSTKTHAIHKADMALKRVVSSLLKLIAAKDQTAVATEDIAAFKALTVFEESVKSLEKILPEHPKSKQIGVLSDELKPSFQQVALLANRNQDSDAHQLLANSLPQSEQLLANLDSLIEQTLFERTLQLNEYEEKANNTIKFVLLNVLLSLLAFFAICVRLSRTESAWQTLKLELSDKVKKRTQELENNNDVLQHTLHELQEAQAELIESEKLASLAELATQIAEEINAPTGSSIKSINSLKFRLQSLDSQSDLGAITNSEVKEFVGVGQKEINQALNHLGGIQKLINNFKRIAGDEDKETTSELNLEQYVNQVISKLRLKLNTSNFPIRVICPEPIEITTYPTALYQILYVLLTNSHQHGFEGVKQGNIEIRLTKQSNYAFIDYVDSGKGICESVLHRVFEPFFTTKRDEGYAGVGLQIAYNLVKNTLEGEIECRSEPEQGTRFIIKFPCVVKKQEFEAIDVTASQP